MRLFKFSFLVSATAMLYAAPAMATPNGGGDSPRSGQSAQSPVNSSRPLTGDSAPNPGSIGKSAAAAPAAAVVEPGPEQAWDEVLSRYVSAPDEDGLARFDYRLLKADTEDYQTLAAYIAHLEAQDPDTLSDNEAVAYWANLYNAVTVRLIVDRFPVSSIRKIKSGPFSIGPWGKKLITVNGERLSLDNVEHDIMRKQFPSPLIHYMVNCASVGCPNLKAGVWRAETLDADRDAAARAFINSPRGALITEKGLTVSSIYKWFKIDFGGDKDGVLAHLRDYADADLVAAIDAGIRIKDYDYDWALNGGSDDE